jgi:hypothetical protein
MAKLDDCGRNARANGLLVDTNLLVLLIVGLVNRDRISRFKRTTGYSSADSDLAEYWNRFRSVTLWRMFFRRSAHSLI